MCVRAQTVGHVNEAHAKLPGLKKSVLSGKGHIPGRFKIISCLPGEYPVRILLDVAPKLHSA